jgi:ribosomal protein L37E
MYDSTTGSVCPKCVAAEEDDYEKVRAVLEQNQNLSAEQVSEESEVALETVLRLLESGRIAAAPAESLKCGRCGKPAISFSKKLCEKCLHELNTRIMKEQSKIKLPKAKKAQVGTAMNVRKWQDGGDPEG